MQRTQIVLVQSQSDFWKFVLDSISSSNWKRWGTSNRVEHEYTICTNLQDANMISSLKTCHRLEEHKTKIEKHMTIKRRMHGTRNEYTCWYLAAVQVSSLVSPDRGKIRPRGRWMDACIRSSIGSRPRTRISTKPYIPLHAQLQLTDPSKHQNPA
jgi:hypothetical protein